MQRLADYGLLGVVATPPPASASILAPARAAERTDGVTRYERDLLAAVAHTQRQTTPRISRPDVEKRLAGLGVDVYEGNPGPRAAEGVYITPTGVTAVGPHAGASWRMTRGGQPANRKRQTGGERR